MMTSLSSKESVADWRDDAKIWVNLMCFLLALPPSDAFSSRTFCWEFFSKLFFVETLNFLLRIEYLPPSRKCN